MTQPTARPRPEADAAQDSSEPHSASLEAGDVAYHLHPFTNLKRHEEAGPLVIERGEGVRVFDRRGKAYIEGLAGLWCVTLGFSEQRLVEAAQQQMRRLPFAHSFGHRSHPGLIELARRLIAIAPRDPRGRPMSKVFFADSGSEANDTAMKLVWYYNNARGRPEKKKIISRLKAYHGVTIATGSLTGLPHVQGDFDLPISGVLHADCPHHYRFGAAGESEEDFAARLARNLEALILEEGPETVAAFFAEPVMAAGGVIVPPAGYFARVQAVLRRYDVLFVVDEVVSGFGRTGAMFGCETFDLQPDMMTLAKGLTSGYAPMSALLVSEPIYRALVDQSERLGTFGHGFTYSGHPVAAAVALEALRIYESDRILDHVGRVGPLLQAGLRRFRDHPLVGEVRGLGLIGAVELVRDKRTREPFDPEAGVGAHLAARAQEHGVLLRAMGDAAAFAPPLVIGEAEIEEMLERFGRALDDTLAMVRERGLAPAG
jgi:4-aminobutyrate--pyruvate transaminase